MKLSQQNVNTDYVKDILSKQSEVKEESKTKSYKSYISLNEEVKAEKINQEEKSLETEDR